MRRITMRHGMTGARLRSPLRSLLQKQRLLAGSLPRPIATRRHMSPAPCCSACLAAVRSPGRWALRGTATPGPGHAAQRLEAAAIIGSPGANPSFFGRCAGRTLTRRLGAALGWLRQAPLRGAGAANFEAEVQMIFATVVAKIFIGYTCQKQGG